MLIQKPQIVLSAVIAFQLLRYRNEFQNAIIYEGVLYTILPSSFIILIHVYFKRSGCVVTLSNNLVKFEQKLLHGKETK